jgi:hypothetical protein
MPWVFQSSSGIEEIHLPGKLVLDNSEVYVSAGLAGLGLLQGMDFFTTTHRNRTSGGGLAEQSCSSQDIIRAVSTSPYLTEGSRVYEMAGDVAQGFMLNGKY